MVGVQKSLDLSPEQQRHLMLARTYALTSLSGMLHERAQLAASLQVGLIRPSRLKLQTH